MAISNLLLRRSPYFPKKIHLYRWHPNLFLLPLCTKKISNDYPVQGCFSETISVDMPQQYLAKFTKFLATCWILLSKYGEFRNFFPVIWRFGVIEGKKRKKKSPLYYSHLHFFFVAKVRKFAPKKTYLAAQCLPGFGNPYPLICLLDHCK